MLRSYFSITAAQKHSATSCSNWCLPTVRVYQNVFLTDEELADLQASFPTVWGQYIEKLSEYMASTGKRYQSHAATIRRWAGEDAKKAAPPTRNRDYSVKEDETV